MIALLAACAISLVAPAPRATDTAGAFMVVPGLSQEGRVRAAVEQSAAAFARNGAVAEVAAARDFTVVRVEALPEVLERVVGELQAALAASPGEIESVSHDAWTAANHALVSRLWSAPAPTAGDIVTVAWTPRPDLLASCAAAKPVPARRVDAIEAVGGGTHCLASIDADPPVVVVGVPMRTPDDESFFAAQLAAHILSGGYSSRLHRTLRIEMQKVYTIESSAMPVSRTALTLRVAAQTRDPVTVRDTVVAAIEELRARPASQEELETARAVVASRVAIDADSPRAALYARALFMAGLGSEPRADATRDMTPERLRQLLERNLDPARLTTVMLSAKADPLCRPAADSGGER